MLKCKFILLSAFVIMMFNFDYSFSQEFPPKGRERMETAKKMKLLEILDLSESESEKFLIKYTASEKLIKEKNEQFQKANTELIEYMDKNPDGKELSDKTNFVLQSQKDLHSAMESKYQNLKQVLNDKNFAKFVTFEIQFARRLKNFLTDRDEEPRQGWENMKPRRRNK